MNDQRVKEFLAKGELRRRTKNVPQAQSLLRAAKDCAAFATGAPINDQTSTGIFKELYDALRQIGDAKWWMMGFESYSHKASIELLKEADIPHKQRLQQLSRIMELRNDASYRGHRIPVHEARELLSLWEDTNEDLMLWVNKQG